MTDQIDYKEMCRKLEVQTTALGIVISNGWVFDNLPTTKERMTVFGERCELGFFQARRSLAFHKVTTGEVSRILFATYRGETREIVPSTRQTIKTVKLDVLRAFQLPQKIKNFRFQFSSTFGEATNAKRVSTTLPLKAEVTVEDQFGQMFLSPPVGGGEASVLSTEVPQDANESSDGSEDSEVSLSEFFDTGITLEDVENLPDFVDDTFPDAFLRDTTHFDTPRTVVVDVKEPKAGRVLVRFPNVDVTTTANKLKEKISNEAQKKLTPDMFKLYADGQTMDGIIDDYLNVDDRVLMVELRLFLKGGGVSRHHHLKKEQDKKKSAKAKDTKKSSQEIRNDAKEVASSVQQTWSLPAVQQADAILSSFMLLSEKNPSDALIGRLKILGEDDLKAIYDALSGLNGGSTDYKIRQVSRHLFNPELKPVMDVHFETGGIIETAELTFSTTYHQLIETITGYNLGKMKVEVKTYLDRKIGERERDERDMADL